MVSVFRRIFYIFPFLDYFRDRFGYEAELVVQQYLHFFVALYHLIRLFDGAIFELKHQFERSLRTTEWFEQFSWK